MFLAIKKNQKYYTLYATKVTETYQRLESYRNGSQMEIDILLANDKAAVVVEVKTTLKVADVRAF